MLFGYSSINDLVSQVFKGVDTQVVLKFFIPFVIGIDLIFQFLFQTVGGIYFLMTLYGIDFITGVAKSIMYSNEVRNLKLQGKEIPQDLKNKMLVSKKFPRFLFTMLAALILLSILKFAGIYVLIFSPLYSIFYAVFMGQQIISITENFSELKLVPFEVAKKLKEKFYIYNKNDRNKS